MLLCEDVRFELVGTEPSQVDVWRRTNRESLIEPRSYQTTGELLGSRDDAMRLRMGRMLTRLCSHLPDSLFDDIASRASKC